jgi:hypothetical protein
MASEVPEYFLPRNWNYPPSGPIKLGNVFASLKEPHRPIATVQPGVESIITSRRTLATIETENARSGGVTLMTTFMSALLGAGVDASVDVGKRSVSSLIVVVNITNAKQFWQGFYIRYSGH